PALAGTFLDEQRQLSTPRIGADEGEHVRSLDHVHADMARHEVGVAVAVRDPERDVIERLGPHPAQSICRERGPDASLTAIDSGQKLSLVHPRASADVQALRLVVELLLRLALRTARPGAKAASAAGRDV